MKTFDQSDIMKLIQHATEIGKTSNEELSKPFLDSILSMKLSGSGMHKNIGNHINNEHKNVLKSFNNVFKSASDYVNDTQNMQSTERPSDFKKDPVKDLLDTKSRGVPLEDKDFHKRIPKIEIEENPADETTKPNVTPKPRTTPRIIRGKNTNNAVVGLSPAPKIGSVFDALDNLIQYGKNAIKYRIEQVVQQGKNVSGGLISDRTKEPETNPDEVKKPTNNQYKQEDFVYYEKDKQGNYKLDYKGRKIPQIKQKVVNKYYEINKNLSIEQKKEEAVKVIDNISLPKSHGVCGRFVHRALKTGGFNVQQTEHAKNLGPYFKNAGFKEVNIDYHKAQKGDVVVFDAALGHPSGHTAIYNGKQWVSDFKQNNFIIWPGFNAKTVNYKIYRP